VPERLERITVAAPSGDVTITWDTRQMLMERLAQRDDTAGIRRRFDAVGASRSVELNRDERLALRGLLDEWLCDEKPPDEQELTDLYIALNKGEPSDAIVEMFAEADTEAEPRLRSINWRWRWAHWRDRQDPNDDHQHCMFCHTNIEDDALTEAWCSVDANDYERWVCGGCFEKLRERFAWSVEPASSAECGAR
jgi:hypothetical protein